ncbi:unnamed protein product [Thelazia callipaeda]|uniref:tRNA pseudouridine(55) synthase n=1 Tax=Thelazia callipaeda TaxID=103827 RepID=A0A0N5CX03_THECL|nr:unnamed protein product [Thelazia callipaeda]
MMCATDFDCCIPLCSVCTRHLKGFEKVELISEPNLCPLCFGVLNEDYIDKVMAEVKSKYVDSGHDAESFMLAINMPVTTILREALYGCAYHMASSNGTLFAVPFKLRIISAYLERIRDATGLTPSVNSDLTLTLTFTNDEFNETDVDYLRTKYPNDFQLSRKRLKYTSAEDIVHSLFTKVRIANMLHNLNREYALFYKMASPSTQCSFSVSFKRNSIFIAGRYCKFSRFISQSPWFDSTNDTSQSSNPSISEIIGIPFIEETKCDSVRFVALGREDIDVRMLGNGRPFVIQLINPKKLVPFRSDLMQATLNNIRDKINENRDVRIPSDLKQITSDQASLIKKGQDDKRKIYTGYCYSAKVIDDSVFEELSGKAPIEIIQKTPVRVLKRRPLLERKRTIFSMMAMKLDDNHFILKLLTQAGTYVKEFVHGDFGRTRPSLADLLDVKCGEIDILDLDVNSVEMDWPPRS